MALSCPKCQKELTDFEIEGINLNLCDGCKGIWFDHEELIYFLKAHVGISNLEVAIKNPIKTDRLCPRCNKSLEELKFIIESDTASVVDANLFINRCPDCHGIWLDEGEFEKVKSSSELIDNANSKISSALKQLRNETPIIYENIHYSFFGKNSLIFIIAGLLLGAIFLGHSCKYTPQPISKNQEHCRFCKGTGKITQICRNCNGTGQIFKSSSNIQTTLCPKCGGKGKMPSEKTGDCNQCKGTGWIGGENKICNRCDGTGRRDNINRQSCPICRGTGQEMVKQRCSLCGGTGKSSINPQWGCPNCSGSGFAETKKTCSRCTSGIIETKEFKVCPDCKGRGQLFTERRICDECLGQKKSISPEMISCDQCSGKGVVPVQLQGEICPDCRGTGHFNEIKCEHCGGKGVS